jgi:hypothetical protein
MFFSKPSGQQKAKDQQELMDKLVEQHEIKVNKIPFDIIFMKYIFMNNTNLTVRQKALSVLIKNFNQRDILIKELSRTELIVSPADYRIYTNFLSK